MARTAIDCARIFAVIAGYLILGEPVTWRLGVALLLAAEAEARRLANAQILAGRTGIV